MSNYKQTAAALASMVSELAESLADAYTAADVDGIDQPKPYPAERTKYDDRPLQLVPPLAPLPDEPLSKPTYALPYPPPLEHRVVDTNGRRWTHYVPGRFRRVLVEDAPTVGIPEWAEWSDLLVSYGPVTLDEWTDEEKAGFELYGPPGGRWGNPNEECPFYACALGVGHIGMHYDDAGNPIGASEADGSTVDASITPHEASQTPCTCGHPDRHRPGCPRYDRVSGVATEYADPDAAAVLAFLNEEERDYEEEAANQRLTEEE